MVVTCAAPVGCLSVAALAEVLVEFLAEDKGKRLSRSKPRHRALVRQSLAKKGESQAQLRAAEPEECKPDDASITACPSPSETRSCHESDCSDELAAANEVSGSEELLQRYFMEEAEKQEHEETSTLAPSSEEEGNAKLVSPETDHPSSDSDSTSAAPTHEESAAGEDFMQCVSEESGVEIRPVTMSVEVEMSAPHRGSDLETEDAGKSKGKGNGKGKTNDSKSEATLKDPIPEDKVADCEQSRSQVSEDAKAEVTDAPSLEIQSSLGTPASPEKLFVAALNSLVPRDCPTPMRRLCASSPKPFRIEAKH